MGRKIKYAFKFSLVILILISLCGAGCSTAEPPDDPEPVLKLELEDVSCTEAWITLTATNLQLPAAITLKKNEETIETINLSTTDSLFYIDSLLPNFTYNFQAIGQSTIQSFSQTELRSNKLSVTTMDTTSHNFTWQTWTFGEHSSSVLYDVAIIDENNIWAVGEIYMNDSLGNPDPTLYNLIKWDGNDWKVERVYYNYQGSNFIAPLRSIFTFSINDVWVGSNQPMHWTGNTWQKWDLLGNIWDGWINKIWGSSSSDIYVVGNGGNIAHWNGSKWTKIESGTTLDINDIWGAKKSNSEEYEIVVIASNSLQNDGREVMIIKNNTTFKQLTDGLSPYYSGVWFKPERKYYIVGGGVHKKNNITDLVPWYRYPPGTINNYYSNDIGGNNLNDIIVCGSFGEIIHFNGVSWTNYTSATYMSNGTYISVSMKSNLVVITGFEGGKAVITFGRR